MDTDHVRIEIAANRAYVANVEDPISKKSETSDLWLCILVLWVPFRFLWLCLLAILTSLRLALPNVDRVIFVFATSILSFYQVPKKVFYIYIAVLIVTGFIQFLRFDSPIRDGFLYNLNHFTIGISNQFLRKYTSLHFSNPYTRAPEPSETILLPVGHTLPPYGYSRIEVFEFPVTTNLSLEKKEVGDLTLEKKKVGDCKITIKTLEGSKPLEGSSVVRILEVEAPWGDRGITFSMSDGNLRRFISYLDHVTAMDCREVICTADSSHLPLLRASSIVETIEHFDRGLSLVKLKLLDNVQGYYI